jgi:ankyrin repeat protein
MQIKNIKINDVFIQAIRYQNIDIVKFCIKQNADIYSHRGRALRNIAYKNNLDIMRYLVDECGANIHSLFHKYEILHIAEMGGFNIIKYFVEEKGIDIQPFYIDILKSCARRGHLNMIQFCVEKGANLYTPNNDILHWSAIVGKLDITKYYLENNDIIKNSDRITTTHLYSENEKMAYIDNYIVDVKKIYKEIFDALVLTAKFGRLNVMKYYMKYFSGKYIEDDKIPFKFFKETFKDISPGSVSSVKYSIHININKPFKESIESGKISVIRYLVKQGADIHTNIDETLQYSIIKNHINVVKYLVKQGANIHTNIDKTLQTIIQRGCLAILIFVVECGVDIHNNIDEMLQTSIQFRQLEIASYLIKCGANICFNIDEIFHYGIPYYFHNLYYIRFFIENGIDKDAIVLKYIQSNRYVVVKNFIKHNIIDINTVIKLCIENKSYNFIQYIIEDSRRKKPIYHLDVNYDNIYFMKQLIRDDMIINNRHEYDSSPTFFEDSYYLQLMRYLIRSGDKNEILQFAVCSNRSDILKYLGRYGIDVTVNNNAVLCYSIEHGHTEIIDYLIKQSIKRGLNISIIRDGKDVKFKTKYKHIIEFISDNIDIINISHNDKNNMTISVN